MRRALCVAPVPYLRSWAQRAKHPVLGFPRTKAASQPGWEMLLGWSWQTKLDSSDHPKHPANLAQLNDCVIGCMQSWVFQPSEARTHLAGRRLVFMTQLRSGEIDVPLLTRPNGMFILCFHANLSIILCSQRPRYPFIKVGAIVWAFGLYGLPTKPQSSRDYDVSLLQGLELHVKQ